jgi:hypothetical protein
MAFNLSGYPSYNHYMPSYGNMAAYPSVSPDLRPSGITGNRFQPPIRPSSYTSPYYPGQLPAPSIQPAINMRTYQPPFSPASTTQPIYILPSSSNDSNNGNSAPLSVYEQRKKFWSKFMMNTGSTLAGLALGAYFGKKLLPQAIAQELGSQFRMAILPQSKKDAIAKKAEQAVKGTFLSGYRKSRKIQEDINKITLHEALSDCTTEVLEQVRKSDYTKSLKPEEYAKDMVGKVMSDDQVQTYLGDSVKTIITDKILSDDKFKTVLMEKLKSEIDNTAQNATGFTGWLLRKFSSDLAEKGKPNL